MAAHQDILFATDFSDGAGHALRWAAAFARAFGARIRVVHVLALHDADPAAAESAMGDAVPAEFDDVVETREIVRALTAELGVVHAARRHGADLIVLGTHGRGGLGHVLLGSVAERVVQLAGCPVLTVRPPDQTFSVPTE